MFESSPQFVLQSYVLLRTTIADIDDGTNSVTNESIVASLLTQLVSISLSLYAISDKLINDDSKMFIEKSGANHKWVPTKQFIWRVLFRLCEVVANLFLMIIIAVYFGAFWFMLYFCWLIFVNYILYINGLLDEEYVNIIGYTVAVMNLGVTPRHKEELNVKFSHNPQKQGKFKRIMSKFYQSVVSLLFVNCFTLKSRGNHFKMYTRYLSYYYITSRAVQGLIIVTITIVLFYVTENVDSKNCNKIFCTSTDSRYANPIPMQIALFVCFSCYIIQYLCYLSFFNSMHLGASLYRTTKTLTSNHQFSDAIRLEKIKLRRLGKKGINVDLKALKTILTIIIDENISILYRNKNDISENITHEQTNQYIYFIHEIELNLEKDFDNTQIVLKDVLKNALYYCHHGLINFLISNDFIHNICTTIFENKHKNDKKNLILYAVEHCSHRVDILESIIITNSNIYGKSGLLTMLKFKPDDGEIALHSLMINKTQYGKIVTYLSENYWNLFGKYKTLKFLFENHILSLIEFVKMPFSRKSIDYCYGILYYAVPSHIYTVDIYFGKAAHDEFFTFLNLLKQNKLNITDFCKISHRYAAAFHGCVTSALLLGLGTNDLVLFETFLDLIKKRNKNNFTTSATKKRDYINDNIHPENSRLHNTCFLIEFIEIYQTRKRQGNNDIKFAQMIFNKFPKIDIHNRIHGKTKKARVTPLQLAIMYGLTDIVKIMFQTNSLSDKINTFNSKTNPRPNWTLFKFIGLNGLRSSPKDKSMYKNAKQLGKAKKLSDLTNNSELIEWLNNPNRSTNINFNNTEQRNSIEQEQKGDEKEESESSQLIQYIQRIKLLIEKVLARAALENDTMLFDIVMDLWHNKLKTISDNNNETIFEQYKIDIFKFGIKNYNLLELVRTNSYNDRDSMLWFCIFEKWCNLTNVSSKKILQILYAISVRAQSGDWQFVCRMIHVPFIGYYNEQIAINPTTTRINENGKTFCNSICSVMASFIKDWKQHYGFKKSKAIATLFGDIKNEMINAKSQELVLALIDDLLKANKKYDQYDLYNKLYINSRVLNKMQSFPDLHDLDSMMTLLCDIHNIHIIIDDTIAKELCSDAFSSYGKHDGIIIIELLNKYGQLFEKNTKENIESTFNLLKECIKQNHVYLFKYIMQRINDSTNGNGNNSEFRQSLLDCACFSTDKYDNHTNIIDCVTSIEMFEILIEEKWIIPNEIDLKYHIFRVNTYDERSFKFFKKTMQEMKENDNNTSIEDFCGNDNVEFGSEEFYYKLTFYILRQNQARTQSKLASPLTRVPLDVAMTDDVEKFSAFVKENVEMEQWVIEYNNKPHDLHVKRKGKKFNVELADKYAALEVNIREFWFKLLNWAVYTNKYNITRYIFVEMSSDKYYPICKTRLHSFEREIEYLIKYNGNIEFVQLFMEPLNINEATKKSFCQWKEDYERLSIKYGKFNIASKFSADKTNEVINVNKDKINFIINGDKHDEKAIEELKNKIEQVQYGYHEKYCNIDTRLSTNDKKHSLNRIEIAINRIENSLLDTYQIYSNESNEFSNFLLENLICNKKYFCNKKYKYCLESQSIGKIESKKCGIYLFHSILKHDALSNVFIQIYKYYNQLEPTPNNKKNKKKNKKKKYNYLDYDTNFYLLLNGNSELPIECAVFGSYNEKYQQLKNLKLKPIRFLAPNFIGLVALLHWFQFQTIQLKLKNIVQR